MQLYFWRSTFFFINLFCSSVFLKKILDEANFYVSHNTLTIDLICKSFKVTYRETMECL